VYRWRLHANELRTKLGLKPGRVFRRTHNNEQGGSSPELPDVVWECEYPTMAARDADVTRLSGSDEWTAIEQHMDGLIREFRRGVYELDTAAMSGMALPSSDAPQHAQAQSLAQPLAQHF